MGLDDPTKLGIHGDAALFNYSCALKEWSVPWVSLKNIE